MQLRVSLPKHALVVLILLSVLPVGATVPTHDSDTFNEEEQWKPPHEHWLPTVRAHIDRALAIVQQNVGESGTSSTEKPLDDLGRSQAQRDVNPEVAELFAALGTAWGYTQRLSLNASTPLPAQDLDTPVSHQRRLQSEDPPTSGLTDYLHISDVSFIQIAMSPYHTCGIMVNGSLTCWGFNDRGQCDVPDTGLDWLRLPTTLEDSWSCGITVDGAIHCWGLHADNAEKLPSLENESEVWQSVSLHMHTLCAITTGQKLHCVNVDNIPDFVNDASLDGVGLGGYAVCVLLQGRLHCWGNYKDEWERSEWEGDDGEPWERLTIGGFDVCVWRYRGKAVCWEVRDGGSATLRRSATEGLEWISISPPCGITTDYTIKCWDSEEPALPTSASFLQQRWSAIAAGGYQGNRRCGLSQSGDVHCWGFDYQSLNLVPEGLVLDSIDAEGERVCGIRQTDRSVHCWGGRALLFLTPLLQRPVLSISVGWNHVCVLDVDHRPSCAGLCFSGECITPGDSSLRWRYVSAGYQTTCGITWTWNLCCWASNNVPGGESMSCNNRNLGEENAIHWEIVSMDSWNHVCAIAGEVLQCWEKGQPSKPIESSSGWTDVSVGKDFDFCAVRGNGTLYCNIPSKLLLYPAEASGNPGWHSVRLGYNIQCGILNNGTALCSGWSHGVYDTHMPDKTWRMLTLADTSLCGLTHQNETFCWSPEVPPPAGANEALNIRYAHLSGLTLGTEEVCGYRYLEGRHVCYGLRGNMALAAPDERFFPVGLARFTVQPSTEDLVPAGSAVSVMSVSEDGFPIVRQTTPIAMQFIAGSGSVGWVVVQSDLSAAYSRLLFDDFQMNDLLQLTPFFAGEKIVSVSASDSGLCALMRNHRIWCSGPLSRGMDAVGDMATITTATKHACGLRIGGTLACWGDGPLPVIGADAATRFRQATTWDNVTCVITLGYEVQCWGHPQIVSAAEAVFQGSGWLEIATSENFLCASRISGRLACLHLGGQRFGLVPTGLSTPEVVIGLAPSLSTNDLCRSAQSCITANPQAAPYHNSMVLIENVILQNPLRARLKFLGTRSTHIADTEQRIVQCLGSDCLSMLPSSEPIRFSNIIVEGVGALLDITTRPSASFVRTIWRRKPGLDSCDSSSLVSLENVSSIAVEWSRWEQEGQQYTDPECALDLYTNSSRFVGGLVVRDGQHFSLSNSAFSNLSLPQGAPLVLLASTEPLRSLVVATSSFTGNIALGHGSGGMFVEDIVGLPNTQKFPDQRYSLVNSTFSGNTGTASGGVFWEYRNSWDKAVLACYRCSEGTIPTVDMSSVVFLNNTAKHAGGALTIDGLAVAMVGCSMLYNSASHTGGGISAANGSVTCSKCQFEGNTVAFGDETNDIERSGGGAIAIRECNRPGLVLDKTIFEGNAVGNGHGGALAVSSCYVSIVNSYAAENYAAGGGGCFHFLDVAPDSHIKDTQLNNCTAYKHGGGLAVTASHLNIEGLLCTGNGVLINTAASGAIPSPHEEDGVGGCLVIQGDSEVELSATTISNNYAVQGGGLHAHCLANLDLQDVHMHGNFASMFGASASFECWSDWLLEEELLAARVLLPLSEYRALGSGPVQMIVHDSMPSIFESHLVEHAVVMSFDIVDINGERVTTENELVCTVKASVPGNTLVQPGLLGPTTVRPVNGTIKLQPFGVTARDASNVTVTVACNDLLTVNHTLPFAKAVPTWHIPPAAMWVPSSGPQLIAVEPVPIVKLVMEHPELLSGVDIECTVKAKTPDGAVTSLLNPPPEGYPNEFENNTQIQLHGLYIDAPYGTLVLLSVVCTRDKEILKSLPADVTLQAPEPVWLLQPPATVTSGVSFLMAVSLLPPSSPAANATMCTASIAGNSGSYTRGEVGVNRNGTVYWEDIVVIGQLNTVQRVQVNCSTGFHPLPRMRTKIIYIDQCSPGSEPTGSYTACTACAGMTYSPGGLSPCRNCPGAGASCDNGQLELHNGFFPGSSVYSLTNFEEGFSHGFAPPMTDETALYPCDITEACGVMNKSVGGYYCSAGYSGPLCGVCEKGYSKAGLYCSECWPPWLSITVITLFASAAFVALGYIALFRKTTKPAPWKIIFRMALSYAQMLSSLGQFKAKATEMVQQALGMADAVGNSVFGTGPFHCVFGMEYYSRFVLSISLPFIVGAMVVLIATGGLIFRRIYRPPSFCNRKSAVASKGNASTSPRQPPSLTVQNANKWRLIKIDMVQYFKEKAYLGPTLFVYFFFYNSMVNTLAAIFRCRDEVIDGQQYLEVDLTVRCFNGPHITGMVAAGGLALALNVLFPVALVLILRRNRQALHTSTIRNRYGFLYMGYSIVRGLYWWEAVVLLRKFSVLMVASSITDPFYQALLGVSVMVAFFVVQVNFRPYDNAMLNHLEMVVMACLTITQVVSLGYFRASALQLSLETQKEVDAGVTICLFLVNGIGFGVLAVAMWRTLKQKKAEEQRERLVRTPAAGMGINPLLLPTVGGDTKHSDVPQDDGSPPPSPPSGMVWNYPWLWSEGKKKIIPPGRYKDT